MLEVPSSRDSRDLSGPRVLVALLKRKPVCFMKERDVLTNGFQCSKSKRTEVQESA